METDTLLINYLLGETDEQESAQALAWIQASEENRQYFEQLKWLWQQAHLPAPIIPKQEQAWQSLKSKLLQESKPMPVIRYWRIAAAVLLAAVITALGLLWPHHDADPQMVEADESGTSFLPDGSLVTLNQHSSIFYPAVFKEEVRKVRLKGEGFFNVKHVSGQPFIIDVNDIQIKVLGTSFFVRGSQKQTDVEVKTGQVLVYHKADSVLLSQGETVSVHPDDTTLVSKMILDFKTAQLVEVIKKNGKMALLNERVSKTDDRKRFKDSLDKAISAEGIKPLPSSIRDLLKIVKKAGGDTIMMGNITLDSFVRKMINTGQVTFNPAIDSSNLESRQQKDVIKNILRDLLAEKIAGGANEVESFALTDKEFLVNGRSLSPALLEKFKQKYIPRPGYGIFYGAENQRTQEGFHFDRFNL